MPRFRLSDLDRPYLWLLPALILGGVLRLWNLSDQIVFGDEIHALNSAMNFSLGTILTTFKESDPCIPLATYDRLLLQIGVPLNEISIRLPAAVAGLVTLVLFPGVLARWADRWTASVFGALVALSPLHIFHSRIARPYSIAVLLGFAASICFWRFWNRGKTPWALGYATTGALAVWFLPVVAPFVVAPLLFAVVDLFLTGRTMPALPRVKRLAGASLLLGLFVGGLLGPAWESFQELLSVKSGADGASVANIRDAMTLLSGSRSSTVAAAMGFLAVLGLIILARRNLRLCLFTTSLTVLQALGLAAVRPQLIHTPHVLARYLLVTLPVLLFWTALGMVALWRRWGDDSWFVGRPIVIGVAVAWLVTHPFVLDPKLHTGPFAGTLMATEFLSPAPELPPSAVPAAYRRIAADPAAGTLVEAPSSVAGLGLAVEQALWRIHRRPVILATPWRLLRDEGTAFTTVVFPAPHSILETPGRFVAVHRDRNRLRRLLTIWNTDPDRSTGPSLEELEPTPPRQKEVRQARRYLARFREAWGPPRFPGPDVAVWDLTATSASVAARSSSASATRSSVPSWIGLRTSSERSPRSSSVTVGSSVYPVTKRTGLD